MSRKWYVVPSVEDAEMFAVVQDLSQYRPRPIDGYYIVADKLPIEDATFIASAPELYEALARLDALMDFGDSLSEHDKKIEFEDVTAINEAFHDALAALAKAKGGESGS
jgi:hypothetical protein